MAIGPTDIFHRYSGADGPSSLGGPPSASFNASIGTLTANMGTDRYRFVDSSKIGGGFRDYVVFLEGSANAMEVRKVAAFDSVTGTVTLDTALPSEGLSGDAYRTYTINDLFQEITPAQCAAGTPIYRACYARSPGPEDLDGFSWYIAHVDPGPVDVAIFGKGDSGAFSQGPLANQEVAPDPSLEDPNASWVTPTRKTPQAVPALPDDANFPGNFGLWIRLTPKPNSLKRTECVVLFIMEGVDASMNQVRAPFAIVFNMAGFTPAITLTPDRGGVPDPVADPGADLLVPHNGGVRFRTEVRAQETGLVTPEVPVNWQVSAEGVIVPPSPSETDDDGVVDASFSGPNDASEVGNTTDVKARV